MECGKLKKILAIIIVCLGLLALVPNVESGESGILESTYNTQSVSEVLIDNTSDSNIIPLAPSARELKNVTSNQTRYIVNFPNFIYNTDEITKWEFYLYVDSVASAGNVSMHEVLATVGQMLAWQTNWTSYKTGLDWNSAGADLNQTPIDTVYINTTGNSTFNITTYLDSPSTTMGLIFIAEFGCNISIKGLTVTGAPSIPNVSNSHWKIYYKAGSGQSTVLIKDIWNLEGYVGASPKLASTIYSEISNCTGLSWKNATSDYWYTYWPEYGILEDEYLNFGDGLFILVDTNTTWDHT